MHTSPWSTGVKRWLRSSWYSAGTPDKAAGVYFANTPASSARVRNVLSTPKNTSPTGFDFVRMTWLRAAPASPAWRTLTVIPVCRSNARNTGLDTANESWVTRVIVVGEGAATDGVATTVVAATHATTRARNNARRAIRSPSGVRGARRGARRVRGSRWRSR